MATIADKIKESNVTAIDELQSLRQEVALLRSTNEQLTASLLNSRSYIRAKVDQLLGIMGSNPLKQEELDDNSILEFDPLGIIFESFRHILASLQEKNSQLQMLRDEVLAIFASAQVGIMVLDRECRIISCNNRMKETFFKKYNDTDIFGTPCNEILCMGLIPDRFCKVRQILAGADTASVKGWEFQGRILDVEAAPIHDKAGEVKQIVLVYNDITRLKQSQQQLEQLNAELEQRVAERTALYQELNSELESFCYSVSHDLCAPLRHISNFTSILKEEHSGQLDDAGRDLLKRISRGSDKMGRMIDDLLRISRISRSAMKSVKVDLTRIAESLASMFRESDPKRSVTFKIAKGLSAYGDETLLELVLQNLIGNAWKYSAGVSEALIEFGRENINGKDTFFVKDNGVGFDMTYKDKLFCVFERLHGEEFEGNGVGLATVQRIISRHQGEVWANSQPGQGATFFFTLPHHEQHQKKKPGIRSQPE
jgi:PAS domain S-box-containing protein